MARSARPRPLAARCRTRTSGSSAASASATARVASTLALSATVIRNGYGKCALRCACSRRTQGPRSASSLWTGTTTSSTAAGTATRVSTAGREPVAYVILIPPARC